MGYEERAMATMTEAERCDRCHVSITPAEVALGWLLAMDDGYICPSCYGDDAFCAAGHVLPALEGAACVECPGECEPMVREGP